MAESILHLENEKDCGYKALSPTLIRTSATNNQWLCVASFTLPKGLYYVIGTLRYNSSGTNNSRRGICIAGSAPDDAGVISSNPTSTYTVYAAVLSEQPYARKSIVINNLSDSTTYYVYAMQQNGTGTTVTVNSCTIRYVKLA